MHKIASRLVLTLLILLLGISACRPASQPAPTDTSAGREEPPAPRPDRAAWAADAVFYQIFPERFRNGDASNDPTRATLERHANVPASWAVTPWTGDWYARAAWEQAMSPDFYDTIYHRRYGGDLQGVLDQLDYLVELGITAIYFNPVFYARSLHKYDGNTYHHIDPYFGPDPESDLALMAEETSDPATWRWTAADRLFLHLLDEAHARGLRIIIDGVFNHTGRDFFAFADVEQNQQDSPYRDWYIVNQWDDPATAENEFDYEGWWGVASLPAFTKTGGDLHPGPKQYVFDATARWMDPDGDGDPADGVDGWRLDVADQLPLGFWADWNAHVRHLNPEAYTVSEFWEDAQAYIKQGGFSATMNYFGFALPVKAYLIDNAIPPSRFAELLNERRAVYPDTVQQRMQNLVDSHDTPRLASMIVNAERTYSEPEVFDYDRAGSPRGNPDFAVRAPNEQERQIQRLVALFQMTYVGAPMLYYGTEAGMWGADDPDDRKPMVWPDLTYTPEVTGPLNRSRMPDPVAFDSTLFRFYQNVIALRREHGALRHGAFDVLLTDEERNMFAFSREAEDDALIVVLNRSDEAHSVRIPLPSRLAASRYVPAFLTRDDSHRVQQDAEALLLEMPPRFGFVLQPANEDL